MLANQPVGTYVMRFSAPPGTLGISSVTAGSVVKHFKVVHEPGKSYLLGEASESQTLEEVLSAADQLCNCKVPHGGVRAAHGSHSVR